MKMTNKNENYNKEKKNDKRMENKDKKKATVLKAALAIMILTLLAVSVILSGCGNPNLDNFAKCVTKSGMTFYGAYWCPHCANVKKAFGSSFQYINYVECDDNGPNGNSQKCQQAGVDAFPYFIFGDGMRHAGELSLSLIAEKTGCELPKGAK